MQYNLGILGIFDTTKPRAFVDNFCTLLIQANDSVPADPLDIATLVSQLQKAFTDLRSKVTEDAIYYVDHAYKGHELRTKHAIHHGMEIGITVKHNLDYPNIAQYDARPDYVDDDAPWPTLAWLMEHERTARAFYTAATAALDARLQLIKDTHPNLKCVDNPSEAFVATVPKPNTKLPTI